MINNVDYLNGVCRSREKNLIKYSDFVRFAGLSFDEALKGLKDLGFGKDAEGYEDMIIFESQELLNFIKEYAPTTAIKDYFLIEYDYHNIQALLRCEKLGLNKESMLTLSGKYEESELSSLIKTGNSQTVSSQMVSAVKTAQSLFDKQLATGAKLDNIFIKAEYLEKLSLAKSVPELSDIVKTEIDYKNITSALRSKNVEYTENAFIDGGYLEKSSILCLAERLDDNSLSKVGAKYSYPIKLASELILKGAPLIEFEKTFDSYALKTLSKNKYTASGIDEFILYCYYKINEIKNVRILMVLLNANVSKNDILFKMRFNYAE